MISVISATNRHNSMTKKVSENYLSMLKGDGFEAQLFDLEKVPGEFLNDGMYRKPEHGLREFGHLIFGSADEFVIVMPEYNGSFPGILKLLIDACTPDIFRGKKFALIGVATGRAGNIRGMDHLTDILNYLKAEVYSQKLPISQIRSLVDQDFQIVHQDTIQALALHKAGYLNYLGKA
ncbi:MAG: NAD(P)H-dependent oxidoreductase [Bacteroidia bacterium]